MLIDTHCHLSFKAFSKDCDEVIARARVADVAMITVGSQKDTSEKAITIAKENDGVFASIGFHPTHAGEEEFDYDWYVANSEAEKVVAIGECGIDFFHSNPSEKGVLKKQEEVFRKQIGIAKQKNLPVIMHARSSGADTNLDAYSHVLRIVKDENYSRCVLHCFGASWGVAEAFLGLGCLISFTGIVSFKNASDDLIEVVKKVPNDKFMIETDAPYLSPEPFRGEQNEPAYVEHVGRAIASIKQMDYDDIASITTKTAKEFFKIEC
jgi:TatD DNase family protein